jgi:hypothetical protein
MTRLEISLPDELRQTAEAQAAQRGFPDAKTYLESLVSIELERRRAKAALEEELLIGERSPAREMTPEAWTQLRRDFEKRLAARAGKR